MSDGMKRATLEALKTRSWTVDKKPLTGEQVVALYEAIPGKAAMVAAVGDENFSGRRVDRSLTKLKDSGLIRFERGKGWRRT